VYTVDQSPLVSPEWLTDHLADQDLVAIDVRVPQFYGQAHLPGAVNLPPYHLFDRGGGVPSPSDFARRLGQLGITRTTFIVAYDEGASTAAAQLYWLLSYYRHPRAAVLDGGITRWRHLGLDWEYAVPVPAGATYEIEESDPSLLATADDVRAAIDRADAVLLDVRSPAEYLGLQLAAARNGHIPGAVNLEWSNNLAPDEDGLPRARPTSDLRDLYQQAGITADKEIIVHCQSGHRSSYAFLALKQLGYPRVRHYLAGWQEWGNREDTPIEEG
jgi:thiosulfate/3-mercaptopyruvate sulfurtransferase